MRHTGNPKHDRFGFRYWYDPGAFAEFYTVGNLGRFMGFMQCLIQASFTIAGPDCVFGVVLLLAQGDRIAADAELLFAYCLAVDESLLELHVGNAVVMSAR